MNALRVREEGREFIMKHLDDFLGKSGNFLIFDLIG